MSTSAGRAVASTVTVINLVVAVSILVAPLAADAQQPGKVYRIGYMSMYGHRDMVQAGRLMTPSRSVRSHVRGSRSR
jgi:hypothetical protein